MKQKFLLTMLLLLSIVAPLAALADSFKVTPADLQLGTTATLQFTLDNATAYYGFQAEVTLPTGLEAIKKADGELAIELSDRAPASAEYKVNSNTLSGNSLIMGAFSANHEPFTGTSGNLVNLQVNVTDDFAGGEVKISNIYFIDNANNDVKLDPTSAEFGVVLTGISFRREALTLTVGETTQLVPAFTPAVASNQTVSWSSSDSSVATVDKDGNVSALTAGTATITAESYNGLTATCKVTVEKDFVAVTSITISPTTLELTEGEIATLTATVAPADATDPSITWHSSNEKVATVDENGKVTAIKAGTASITVESSNGKIATCTVTVKAKVVEATGVTLSATASELKVGETLALTATVAPENTTDKSVTWTSDNTAVATVDAAGKVTAVGLGVANITATCGKVSATCKVTVVKTPVTSVTLDKTTLSLTEGDNATLTATVAPANATEKTVTWTSSDETVATVKDGVVTAVKGGTATITATADGKSATCVVTVEAKTIAVTGVTLDKTTLSLTEGETATLTATIAPDNATDKTMAWTSSDETIATVKDGVVTAVKAGTATITVTASGKTATCAVTVAAKTIAVTSVTLDKTSLSLYPGDNATLTATVSPAEATDKTVTWTSSDEAVATVKNGVVTAVAIGTATITATAGDKTATCTVKVVADERTSVPVKMTYVNMDDPDKAYGEIPAGETAEAGFNGNSKGVVSNGTLGFGNTGWGVNYITYLQVDVTGINGTIMNATLSFDASGSTDSKRTTTWGAGYNNSVWSSDMTYNTADKSITKVGEEVSTTTKSASTFQNLSIDITEAVLNAENGHATILIYETAAGGGYIKNPVVKVQWTEAETYAVTFKESHGAAATVIVNKLDVTKGTSLPDGTYTFSATAKGYKDYTGEFTVDGAPVEVEFTMTPKDVWHWTLKNNVNDEVVTGTCLEGESATAAYHRYILNNGTVWMKAPCGGDKKLEYNYTFTPDADNYVATLEYTETATDGIYFIEAEDMEGMTATTGGNAGVRASNSAGGYAAEAVNVYDLKRGTYKVSIACCGKTGRTITVKAGENKVLEYTSNGSWGEAISDEFTLTEAATLTVEGANADTPLDYVLITGEINTYVPVTGIEIWDEDDQPLNAEHTLALYTGDEYTLTEVVSPENATDQKVTWTSSDESIAKIVDIVEEPHQVHIDAIAAGEATITASVGEFSTSFKVVVTDPLIYVTAVILDKTTAEMKTGKTLQLNATIEPDDASSKEVKWTSSDNNIATVSTKGLVTAKKAGKVTITATAGVKKLTATCEITITDIDVTAVTLDKTVAELTTGETLQLAATVNPEDATNKTLTWTSSNTNVATVDANGKVTAVSAGEAVITAASVANPDVKAACTVTVKKPYIAVTEITLNKTEVSVNEGETVQLKAVVTPSNATDATVTWTTSDDAIAIVDENGLVTALTNGTAIITAEAGGKTAECVVTVTKNGSAVELIGLDPNCEVKVYDLNGLYVSDTMEGLPRGTYIVRQGNVAKKVRVRK